MSVPPEEEQRRYWRLLWLSSIEAFCDTETQRTRWVDPTESNPHFSFVECMCCYFDNAYLGEKDAYRKRLASGRVTDAEVSAVSRFHALADGYISPTGDDWDAASILDDPAWREVVGAAQEARHQLLELLTDPSEIEALTRPLNWSEDGNTFRADVTGSTIVRLSAPAEARD